MKKKAFTLVELIIVVTILAILATISFSSFGWYAWEARDSLIISDLKSISKAFEIWIASWNKLPNPDNIISREKIDSIPELFWNKWDFWENSYLEVKRLSNLPVDPSDKNKKYKYFLSEDKKYYYLETDLENGKKFTLTNYQKTNQQPQLHARNNPPRLTWFTWDRTIYSEIKFLVTAQVQDDDGDAVSISSTNLPSWLQINWLNISWSFPHTWTYNFDLVLNDWNWWTETKNISIMVTQLPKSQVCLDNLHMWNSHSPLNSRVSFNSTTGVPDPNWTLSFFVKNYKNYKMSEIIFLINEWISNNKYTPLYAIQSWKTYTCNFDNSDFW